MSRSTAVTTSADRPPFCLLKRPARACARSGQFVLPVFSKATMVPKQLAPWGGTGMCRLCDERRARKHLGSRRSFLKGAVATGVAAAGLNLFAKIGRAH